MKNKLNKALFIIGGIVVVALLLIPPIVKHYAISNSIDLIGRQIQLEKLSYNYFTSTITAYDFKMMEQNGKDHFVSFDTLIVNLEPLQLFRNEIEIEAFLLTGLDINLILKDSLFNFEDLIAFHSAAAVSTHGSVDEEISYKYSLFDLKLRNVNFHFDNQNIGDTTSIDDLSFSVPYIGWDQKEKSNADIKFNFPRGGYFESDLNINPINGEFDAELTIRNLYLDPFYKYVAEYAEINSINGVVASSIHLEGNVNEADKTIVSGKVSVADFSMTDTKDNIFLSAKHLEASLKNLDYFHNSYTIDSISIQESYTFFQLDSVSNNFFQIFRLDDPAEQLENENLAASQDSIITGHPEEDHLYYAIHHLSISQGVLDYTDNLTGDPFDYHLSDIKVDSDSILSDRQWIEIYADMLLNNRGTLRASVGFEPSNMMDATVDISIEKFLLSDINVYSHHYTGYNFLEGDTYYYSKSVIDNGDIESENQLLVKKVALNKAEGGLYSLPLKFVLFLLKDKNGDVNLDIPVRGDLNDPTVKIGKIVWTTFKNLIIKIAASPSKVLINIVGGDPKDIEEITFAYLDTIPSDRNLKQLDKLLEIEQKKEEINIELTYYVDSQRQKEAIVEAEAGKLYFQDTRRDYLKDPEGFEEYLLSKTASDTLNLIQSCMAVTIPEKIDSIANLHSKSIVSKTEEYLHKANNATQIIITYSDIKDPLNVGSAPKLKVNFSLPEDEF